MLGSDCCGAGSSSTYLFIDCGDLCCGFGEGGGREEGGGVGVVVFWFEGREGKWWW